MIAGFHKFQAPLMCGIILFILFIFPSLIWAQYNPICPGADDPPPPVLKVDLPELIKTLEDLTDSAGTHVWKTTDENKAALKTIFESTPSKTKLEQFFQLLYLIQNNLSREHYPLLVEPSGMIKVLLTAKVFTDPTFPQKITQVLLKHDNPSLAPLYTLEFAAPEVRFPINQGKGFATWDQGMCQVAKELVFYNGFSFRVRPHKFNKNLVVDDFNKVELFGDFGSKGIVDVDLKYVELEKVEFIAGTDKGRVKARVAKREFKDNEHSGFFKFIGRLIPNTSTQRIDW